MSLNPLPWSMSITFVESNYVRVSRNLLTWNPVVLNFPLGNPLTASNPFPPGRCIRLAVQRSPCPNPPEHVNMLHEMRKGNSGCR